MAIETSVLRRTRTGTAVYVTKLLESLQQVGHPDLDLITLEGPAPRPHRNIFSRPLNLLSEILWLHVRLPLILKRRGVDLLHMPANVAPLYCPCHLVVSIHDAHFITHPESRDRLWLIYARLAFGIAVRRADRFITLSREASREIAKHLKADPARMRVVYHGATKRRIASEDSDFGAQYGRYLLFTGATMLHKNVHGMVEAFARLIQDPELSDLRLIVAGVPGDAHDLFLAAIDRHGLGDRVLFLGYLSDSRLGSLYEHATLFVFPSKAEGFGLPPLEAMAHGTPVAAARASCIPEILGEAAAYFDPDDPGDMAGVIGGLLKDPRRMEFLTDAGRKRAAGFTWQKCAEETLGVYREVLLLESG